MPDTNPPTRLMITGGQYRTSTSTSSGSGTSTVSNGPSCGGSGFGSVAAQRRQALAFASFHSPQFQHGPAAVTARPATPGSRRRAPRRSPCGSGTTGCVVKNSG